MTKRKKAKSSWRSESAFQQFALSELNKMKGVTAYNIHGNGHQETGIPDILACIYGRFVGFELKAKSGHASKLQKYQIDKIKNAGGEARVVKNWQDIDEVIDKILEEV